MKKIALLCLCLAMNFSTVNAATRLVTTGGGASGDCTSTPCSPQYAINQAQAGDTVSFADGTYSMASDIYTARAGGTFATPSWATYPTSPTTSDVDGACTSVITIKSATQWGAILDGASESGITINHSCIEVDGLKFTGTPAGYGYVVLGYSSGVSGVRVKNIYIDNENIEVDRYVTRVNDASYSYIKDCYLINTWYAVFTNTDSLAHHFIYQGNEVNGANMDVFRPFGHDILYKGNIIHEVTDTRGMHTDLIQSFGNSDNYAYNIIFEGNFFYNTSSAVALGQVSREGVNTANIRDWTFRNNVFVNIGGRWGGDALRQKWYNNTFYKVPSAQANHPLTFGCSGGTSGDSWCANDSESKNNIFVACGLGDTDTEGWYGLQGGVTVTGFVADYNFVAKDNNSAKSGFTGDETNGVSGGDPAFVSESAPYNLAIGAASAAKDKGVSLASLFTTDKLGVSRGAAWDIGAYEYNPSVATCGPGTARSAGAGTVCSAGP